MVAPLVRSHKVTVTLLNRMGSALPVSRAPREPRGTVLQTRGAYAPRIRCHAFTPDPRSARDLLYEESMDAKTLELLQLLGKAWIVTLTCTCDHQWQLCLQSGPGWDEH